MLSRTLFDVIRGYLNNKVNGTEEKFVSEQMDEMQKEMASATLDEKSDIVQQVVFLNLIGYDVSWANFMVLEVMSSENYSAKRIAYTAASQMWNTNTDVVIMATHRIHRDLTSVVPLIANAVLTSIPPYLSLSLAQHIAHDVIALMSGARPQLRQKAIMTFYHICLQYPDALRPGFTALRNRLDDTDLSVVFSALTVMSELCAHNPQNFVSMIPKFHKMLETAPTNWITVRLITILRMLCSVEPRLPKKLVQPFTTILETTSSITVLFECVRTIIDIPITNPILLTYATQRMQAFLEHKDANLRFLCLTLFIKLIEIQPKLVAQHKELITQCLDSNDESTRMLALDLLAALANAKTIDGIVSKMFDHFRDSKNQQFKDSVLKRVIDICSKNDYELISDFEWYITCLIDFLEEGGFTCYNELADQFYDLAARVPDTRQTLVDLMSALFENIEYKDKTRLLLVASFIIGEYANSTECIESLVQPLVLQTDERVQLCCVSAALKLYLRLEEEEKQACEETFKNGLEMFRTQGPAEVQDRAEMIIALLGIFTESTETEEIAALQDALAEELPDDNEPIELPPGLNDPIPLFTEVQEKEEEPEDIVIDPKNATKKTDAKPEEKKPRRPARRQRQNVEKSVVLIKQPTKTAPTPAAQKPKAPVKASGLSAALNDLDLSTDMVDPQKELRGPMPYNQEQLMKQAAKRMSQINSHKHHSKKRRHNAEPPKPAAVQQAPPPPKEQPVTGPKPRSRMQLIGENTSLICNAIEFTPSTTNPGRLEIELNVHNQTGKTVNSIDITVENKGGIKGVDLPSISTPIVPSTSVQHKIVIEAANITMPQKVRIIFVPVEGGVETLDGQLRLFPTCFLIAGPQEEFQNAVAKCTFAQKMKPIVTTNNRDVLQTVFNVVRGSNIKCDNNTRAVYARTPLGHEAIAYVSASAGQISIEVKCSNDILGKSIVKELEMKFKQFE